ncbi:hypothetical protein EIP91_007000 [Steccherinum ochraceum]|uniref:MARVEL domain-containing protein n=1 Tax=Steccherinum ochraceum TaxID=92696 RepID=A0A4R0RYX4_9APHY|nr:hypothetical protein EIP91_007000 [Steccherinum ochraceum]
MVQQKLWIVREAVLGALTTFSIIVLAVNAHYIFVTLNDDLFVDGFVVWPQDSPDTFSLLNVAVAALTLLTVPVMLLLERTRKGAFTSMILFELSWLGVLCILWIAAASFTVDSVRLLVALCNLRLNKKVGVLQSACRDVKASEAFGHLAWVAALGYLCSLFFLSYRSSQAGQPVWRSAVSETHFTTNFTVPGMGHNENEARHDANGHKEADPNVIAQTQNLSYAYPPPVGQPVMQQYNPSQQQMPVQPQMPQASPQPQVPYGQAPYQSVPQGVPTPPPAQAPVAQPYGQAQV